MIFLKQIRKNQKGFTMVEIIVVLVILAILIGAMTPTMMGFINEARSKALVAEARIGLLAAQVTVVENPGMADETNADAIAWRTAPGGTATTAPYTKFKALADDVITGSDSGVFSYVTVDDKGHVTGISYTKGSRWVRIGGNEVFFGTGTAPDPSAP